ncbi:MAG TPA: DUF4012 domain-containing protein [Candidatus Magasanikbacteria bacterium]|mgnify:CR=1 FL=1|nr:DUF4012 domain-containing protein [Candidatus Magasanikbacteria bacterium]
MKLNKKGGIFTLIIMVVAVVLIIFSLAVYYWVKTNLMSDGGAGFLKSPFVMDILQKEVSEKMGSDTAALVPILPRLLGVSRPMNYLVLFLNNTEMRPGGGFIGSYAVVNVERGRMNIVKMSGSEALDRGVSDTWRPEPPAILREHLGVDRWYFRDANWSPDFAESAMKTLELYRGEGGERADSIDGVIGVTTDVFARLLGITGPISVGGIDFNSNNAVEKLEYEVEYGYTDKGVARTDRKDIMEPLALAITQKIGTDLSSLVTKLGPLFQEMSREKHIFMYLSDDDLQKRITESGLSGRVKDLAIGNDAVLWVDANLAALKTDYAIQRNLFYTLKKVDGEWRARVEMKYVHTGKFDWRTTRYRTYARVFVPTGSEFIRGEGAMKWDRSTEVGKYDIGTELGRSWFGAFIAIEPGETKTLAFEYVLPLDIGAKIDAGEYSLQVEKQNGLPELGLTLQLEFGKNVVPITPEETEGKRGDAIFDYSANLREDLSVRVGF